MCVVCIGDIECGVVACVCADGVGLYVLFDAVFLLLCGMWFVQ